MEQDVISYLVKKGWNPSSAQKAVSGYYNDAIKRGKKTAKTIGDFCTWSLVWNNVQNGK